VNLTTGVASSSSSSASTSKNNRRTTQDIQRQDIGSNLQAGSHIVIKAGNDVNAKAATVSSETGIVLVDAKRDINIMAGEAYASSASTSSSTKKGFLSKKTTTTRDFVSDTQALGSTFDGNLVSMKAGNDLTIVGSNVISDNGTFLSATNNLSILAATNTHSESHFSETKKSGLMGTGGVGFTVGQKMNSTDMDSTSKTLTGSVVGSLQGNTIMTAGEKYNQVASTVNSPVGDVSIQAKSVDIVAGYNTEDTTITSIQKQSGFTVALSSK
jgi:filamentous hemagglutinin